MAEGKVVPHDLFLQGIVKSPPAPIYVIYGNEALFAQTVLKQIKKRLLGEEEAVTNLTEADDESEPARLFDILRTRSLFGPTGRQVIVVYSGERFIKRSEEHTSELQSLS
jgi:DNA polymerase III delta subunit